MSIPLERSDESRIMHPMNLRFQCINNRVQAQKWASHSGRPIFIGVGKGTRTGTTAQAGKKDPVDPFSVPR